MVRPYHGLIFHKLEIYVIKAELSGLFLNG